MHYRINTIKITYLICYYSEERPNIIELTWHGITQTKFDSEKCHFETPETLQNPALLKQAAKNSFKTSLQDVSMTPITTHLGQKLTPTASPDIKGASVIYEFLKENKRQYQFRMSLESTDVVTKSNILKALNSLPKILIGRHVW